MDNFSTSTPFAPAPEPLKKPAGIKHIIAVISGKGGVGKSTVSANLACALSKLGFKAGLFDADITGHSQALLFDAPVDPERIKTSHEPVDCYGVKVVSFGFLFPDSKPIIWRGPMISNALKSLFRQTNWPDLDYLIADLPPGTSDAQLTILRDMPIDGAILVTTPDRLAAEVAERGLKMLLELKKPVIGLIENMSSAVCPHCDQPTALFGSGGADSLSKKYGLRLLGQIPLDPEMNKAVLAKKPIAFFSPDSTSSKIFENIAQKIIGV